MDHSGQMYKANCDGTTTWRKATIKAQLIQQINNKSKVHRLLSPKIIPHQAASRLE